MERPQPPYNLSAARQPSVREGPHCAVFDGSGSCTEVVGEAAEAT
jgi:hypothetical protein